MNERHIMAAVGGLWGLALWLLNESWPEQTVWIAATLAAALYFVSVSGLVVHRVRTGRDRGRLVGSAIAIGTAFGAIAFWTGWQLPPEGVEYHGDDARVVTWAFAAGIAIYILVPFVQIFQRTGHLRFPYEELYHRSWNNFFVASLGLVYTAALWIVLLLWGQLFALLGIDFFKELFAEETFVFIVNGAAIGYGLAAARESERGIDALRSISQGLFRALLPVWSAVTLAFLGTLPFTGPEALIDAGNATSVLLPLLAVGILLLNAVFQDGSGVPPYTRLVRWLVESGVFVLPVLAGLAVYAIALRIDQYGLTPQRMYAGLFGMVLSLYALGYAATVVLRGAPWLRQLRAVNVAMAWVWIALALAVHTPLLDPLDWSLRHQLHRLETGQVGPPQFDYAYLRFHLGRRGAEALERLAADEGVSEAVRVQIDFALTQEYYGQRAPVDELALERVPTGAPWPEGLRDALVQLAAAEFSFSRCRERAGVTCLVTPRDLDGDGVEEELVFSADGASIQVLVFSLEPDAGWKKIGRLSSADTHWPGTWAVNDIVDAVRTGAFETVSPRYSGLEVAGRRLHFVPR